jgi:hypothetical protein
MMNRGLTHTLSVSSRSILGFLWMTCGVSRPCTTGIGERQAGMLGEVGIWV